MNTLDNIGLTKEVEYIPVEVSKVPYNFSVKLSDRTYIMILKYNEQGKFFTVDLAVMATGEVLCYGEPIRYGHPMFSSIEDARFPIPVIIPYCLTGGVNEVTFQNLGDTVQLYLYDRRIE